jgi:hypothetical protein
MFWNDKEKVSVIGKLTNGNNEMLVLKGEITSLDKKVKKRVEYKTFKFKVGTKKYDIVFGVGDLPKDFNTGWKGTILCAEKVETISTMKKFNDKKGVHKTKGNLILEGDAGSKITFNDVKVSDMYIRVNEKKEYLQYIATL